MLHAARPGNVQRKNSRNQWDRKAVLKRERYRGSFSVSQFGINSPVIPENFIRADLRNEKELRASSTATLAMLHLLGTFVANLFKSRRRLEVKNLFLRHQLNIALRLFTAPSAGCVGVTGHCWYG